MTEFQTTVTATLFAAAAVFLWTGKVLLPAPIGTFFVVEDFARVFKRLHLWIWLYRIHLFGFLIAVMALVALATLFPESSMNVVLWPGVVVCAGGLFVGSLAQAFYYHFGAWGAIDMHGKSDADTKAFVQSLQVPTEYVTCLTRFGRVFFGLGQVVLGAGFYAGGLFPVHVSVGAIVLGVAAMAVTMLLGDRLNLYEPIFHLNVLWFGALAFDILSR